MMDTQWKRYQVFEKERADLPHRNTGSIHAPDAEMALENARDVFVRRPECLSLWVAPEAAIFARTMQELQNDAWYVGPAEDAPPQTFLVFQKQGQAARETFVAHVGQVAARSPHEALSLALKTFPAQNIFVWWIVPERAIIKSEDDDAASMFMPARDKKYRRHTYYPVEPIMRELKSAQGMLDNE